MRRFRELARGKGGAEAIKVMLAGERSRRLLMVWLLLDQLKSHPDALGPLPHYDRAWAALVKANEQDSATVEKVLLSPQVGIWLSRMLRLLRGRAVSAGPLWVELGHLHAIAFAVAVRTKTALETSIPARAGHVMIPTLGMACLPATEAWSVVEAGYSELTGAWLRLGEPEVVIPAATEEDGNGWWGLREVVVGHDAARLDIWLDDLDPYRDLADPVPAVRLSDSDFQRWRRQIGDAWQIVSRVFPETAEAMGAGMQSLAPLPEGDRAETRSSSTGDGFGSALISPPADPVALAVALIHEFQHIKLGGLLHMVSLLEPEMNSELSYAPWRNDPRPISGLLQGVFAFFGIAQFWQNYRHGLTGADRAVAEFEFAYARRQTRLGMNALRRTSQLTDLGRSFVAELSREVRSQHAEPVTSAAARTAWAAATDHQVVWKLRHFRPDPDGVGRLARMFLAGRPPRGTRQVESILTPQPGEWNFARVALHRDGLYRPELVRGGPEESSRWSARHGASQADLALVQGRIARAAAGYRAMIAADPDDISAWSGLAVANGATAGSTAWKALTRRPDLVRAVYVAAHAVRGSVSPLAVAVWLDADRGRAHRS
ncbi:HEXXH motif domain-containing protein [Winogradskya humida]|uniref:HEXXH motif domain-containing protein n=1 Tax=Winogradskya humida TaxID=113566 RepID=UPI001941059E|nr:HEXXH motif domain-containing protein [Actinoplanes humidus]